MTDQLWVLCDRLDELGYGWPVVSSEDIAEQRRIAEHRAPWWLEIQRRVLASRGDR